MDYAGLFGIGLQIIEQVLAQWKSKSGATAVEQIQNAEAALAKLKEVHGSPVTKAQLDSLRG
jgi:hypothetical protein